MSIRFVPRDDFTGKQPLLKPAAGNPPAVDADRAIQRQGPTLRTSIEEQARGRAVTARDPASGRLTANVGV